MTNSVATTRTHLRILVALADEPTGLHLTRLPELASVASADAIHALDDLCEAAWVAHSGSRFGRIVLTDAGRAAIDGSWLTPGRPLRRPEELVPSPKKEDDSVWSLTLAESVLLVAMRGPRAQLTIRSISEVLGSTSLGPVRGLAAAETLVRRGLAFIQTKVVKSPALGLEDVVVPSPRGVEYDAQIRTGLT